jgi:NadR type nicotinamide-nucleotide adenylyltransferase
MSYTAKPANGFVLGKFMPPHQGHVFLCEFARQYCARLTILVCSTADEPISGELRYEWMKELFPDCIVLHETRDLPQAPRGADDEEFWKSWRQVVGDAMRVSTETLDAPDLVFASEDYGLRLAREVGARFVPCDLGRLVRPISGSAIREDPFRNWEYIPQVVRPYFVKRVVVFGPESTGKSTLVAQLAIHYETLAVPEYGRTYTQVFGTECDADDLQRIVLGHMASVSAAKRQANKILIEDTDPILTAIWSEMLIGERDPWFDEFDEHGDLYLLTDVDIPWENDGTRYFRNDEDRIRFFNKCENELVSRGIHYVRVSGSREERFATATAAIDKLMAS